MKNSLSLKISKKIYFINFNQNNSCFCIGTDEGYEIYNTDPFKKIVDKKLGKLGVCYISMLYRTNVLIIILKNTHEQPNNEKKIIIWDDNHNKKIGEIEFNQKLKTILLRKQYIIVSLSNCVYIYKLDTLELFKKIKTYTNFRGLVSCTYDSQFLISCLSPNSNKTISIYNILEPTQKVIKIDAHKSEITFLKLSHTGNLLATSSEKGTLIRIYHTLTGEKVKELRRGSEQISIDWINFSHGDEMILCRSKKGTIHLFNIGFKNEFLPNKNNKKLSFAGLFKSFLPKYFNSEWSFAHFHFPNKRTISVFTKDLKHIIVISFQGIFYKINFTNNEYVTILKEHL